MSPLFTFSTLRAANVARLPTFKNVHGEPAHSEPDGSDWSIPEWSNAMAGEVGELADVYLLLAVVKASGNAANLTKKYSRGDLNEGQLFTLIAKELADVAIYLDLLAFRCGIDLGAAVFDKFNAVSERVRSPIVLDMVSGKPIRDEYQTTVIVRNIKSGVAL